nr:MAG TPA_asm: hypothetical protein [Caudoviricetes sp.]
MTSWTSRPSATFWRITKRGRRTAIQNRTSSMRLLHSLSSGL